MALKRYIPIVIILGAVTVIQVYLSASGRGYYLSQLTMSAYYAIVAVGLCLLMGYAGQISLGHAGFFAIGGYTSAVLTTLNLASYQEEPVVVFLTKVGLLYERTSLYGAKIVSFSPWIAFLCAVLVTLVIAFAIAVPIIRLKGHYLAMATLGFGLIVYTVVHGTKAFGQSDGIASVPPFTLVGNVKITGHREYRVLNYYLAWGFVALVLTLSVNLVCSRVGRALRSIHGNEQAADALGIPTAKYKIYTFVLSGVFASLAGTLLTHYNGGIAPGETSVMRSVRYVAIVAVGGMDNLWGVLFMGVILNFLSLRGIFGTYDAAVFGAILVGIMVFAPRGLLRGAQLQSVASILWKKAHGRNST